MVTIGNPYAESPKPSAEWAGFNDDARAALAAGILVRYGITESVEVVKAAANGNVTVRLKGHPNAADRGVMLREYERQLWDVSPGLYVYVEPEADRNRLRQLRGVKVKE